MVTALIGAPTSLGAFAPGQEQAPGALRAAGLTATADFGDIELRRWAPDRESRRAQNAAGVARAARDVAERVEAAIRSGHVPVVLGGDCTVGVGTVAGAQRTGSLGLVYFDMHPDLHTPETAETGTLDWMGMAHMLSLPGTVPELAAVASLQPEDVLLFARDRGQTRKPEQEAIDRLGLATVELADVAADPRATAQQASERFERYLVHFDVDVVDFVDLPLSENTGHNIGLPFAAAAAALEVLAAGPGFAGLTVTEHNPAHGPEDGSATAALAAALQRALS
ncbi:MAG TPA: arginase family protein [Solirubrobacteraceae bacterium]|nr:arginase family protein [Solirubrobacteraceae bacterium]